MRLELHIGTEKTGSTAIQEHLHGHREQLIEAGVALPLFLGSANHRALASIFVRDEQDDDYLRAQNVVAPERRAVHREKLLAKLERSIEQARRSADRYVISAEHFHSRLLAPGEVQHFARCVAPLFDSVRVRCYLRRQDQMALSFYTQKLRSGFIPPTILPILNVRRLHPSLPPFFDFESLLQRWADALPDASIEPAIYDRAQLEGGDVVTDFYAWLGVTKPGGGAPVRANASLSGAGQMALLALNRVHGGDLAARTRSRPLREDLNQFLQQRAQGPGVRPSRAEAQEFAAAFDASNRRVAERWFDRRELFPPLDGEYGDMVSGADWEQASVLLAEFLGTRWPPGAVDADRTPGHS
jgi:hypothetical protein